MPSRNLVEQGERRRKAIYSFVKKFWQKNGYGPSIAEICEGVGVASPNAVLNHLHKMRDAGTLKMAPGKARSIRIAE